MTIIYMVNLEEEKISSAINSLIDLSDRFYMNGYSGLKYIPIRARLAIFIAANIYRGIGSKIVKELQKKANEENTGIWCNARIKAVPMYARCGFEIVSDIFEIESIGPHYDMEWK